MKLSTIFTVGIVVMMFLVIQGWVLARAFIAPRVFIAREASIAGETIEVRAPIQGMIRSVLVQDYQRVRENQALFTITRIVTDPVTLSWRHEDLPVTAVHPGIITKVQARSGLFAQADQKLAVLIDNSPETLRITASLAVAARDVPRIRPGMPAEISAEFLNGGRPVPAVVDSVDPVYDARTETLPVELQMLRYPDDLETLPLGLPVEVTVRQERRADDNIVIALYTWFFPRSRASAE